MPIFNKKPKPSPTTVPPQQYDNNNSKAGVLSSPTPMNNGERRVPPPTESNVSKPQLVFHCQLAHGSPTGLISGFSSVKELYQKIAECYDFSVDEVSFFHYNCHINNDFLEKPSWIFWLITRWVYICFLVFGVKSVSSGIIGYREL